MGVIVADELNPEITGCGLGENTNERLV